MIHNKFKVFRRILFILVLISIILYKSHPVKAQDEFGPICDTVIPGTTCAPTNTTAPRPTSAPRPQQLPVAGNMETTLLLLAASSIFTIIGFTNIVLRKNSDF